MTAYTKLWTAVAGTILLSLLSLAMLGIRINYNTAIIFSVFLIPFSMIAFAFRDIFETQLSVVVIDAVHAFSLFLAISWAGAIASYAVAARSHGWLDDIALGWDNALHFHWLDLYRVYPKHFLVVAIGRTAYASMQLTPLLLIMTLAIYRRLDVLERFITIFAIALGVTVAIFAFFPMQSALVYLLHRHVEYQPLTSDMHVSVIEGLRSGSMTRIDPLALIGLIGFPSFHTTCGVIFAWVGWQIRIYRVPMLVLNVAMIASTPIEGAHYLSDLVGGILVAAVAIALSRTLGESAERQDHSLTFTSATAHG